MNELSNKAVILLNILEKLNATDEEHKTNIYTIMSELEKTELKTILPEEEECELESIACEMTQKSISTTLASLVRKGYVKKTGVGTVQVGNENKNVRGYYLANKQD